MVSRWKVGAALVIAAVLFGIAGGVSNWFQPREKRTEVAQTRKVEAKKEQASTLTAKVEQRAEAAKTQRVRRDRRRQSDLNVRVTERIERYAPAVRPAPPAGTSSPMATVSLPGELAEPPRLTQRPVEQPIEVITRTIDLMDKSTAASTTAADQMTTANAASTASTTATTAASEMVKASDDTKTVTTSKPAAPDEPGRLGVAVTSDQRPAATFDLVRGPKIIGLDKLGAGVIVTGPRFSNLGAGLDEVDAGPQVNYAISRGSFVGLGYTLRHSRTFVFAGLRF